MLIGLAASHAVEATKPNQPMHPIIRKYLAMRISVAARKLNGTLQRKIAVPSLSTPRADDKTISYDS
jgi:hypothetical protein